MTIALGILATGGAVIAADRQETSGNFKASMGKIQAHWISNRGTLVMSGAGNGPYIDSLTDDLIEWFKQSKDKARLSTLDVENEFRRQHKKFYRDNVLPVSQWAQHDVPDYELLVAYGRPHANESTLWTSHKLSVVKEHEFAAVGCGSPAAKAMLQRLGFPFMELEIAAALAVYIIYQVKRTVDLVGLETDVFIIQNSVPLVIPRADINEMESRFDSYGAIERDSLFYCLGGDLARREQSMGLKPGEYNRNKKALRKFFEEWTDKRRERLSLPPTPSTPRKLKDQQ